MERITENLSCLSASDYFTLINVPLQRGNGFTKFGENSLNPKVGTKRRYESRTDLLVQLVC